MCAIQLRLQQINGRWKDVALDLREREREGDNNEEKQSKKETMIKQ